MIKRQSKHQALIIVSGSEGRIEKAQNIAQLLSSRGYICLAIAYSFRVPCGGKELSTSVPSSR